VHENQVCMWMKESLFVETLHAAEAQRVQELNWSLIALAKEASKSLEKVLDNVQALTGDIIPQSLRRYDD
jgi:hypothetical protein